jgi:O-methyltransferase
VLRADGDMYGSTMDILRSMEPRVAPGGFVIIDDYGAIEQCRQAVADYRADAGIDAEIHEVDWTGVYWRKPREAASTLSDRPTAPATATSASGGSGDDRGR